MERKLYKSTENKVLTGVCGGIGEYFDVDPVIVRLLVVVFTLMGGAGLIAYIIAAIIIPDRDYKKPISENYSYDNQEFNTNENPILPGKNEGGRIITLGIILIALGGLLLIKGLIPWIPREVILAGILIGLGIYFIIKKSK